jgi:hypothetical protein
MNETVARTAVGRLVSTRGVQTLLRVLVLVGAVGAFAATSAAAGGAPPLVAVVVVVLAGVCALDPESHVGLLIVGIVGVHWLVSVDDSSTPWSLAAGGALATMHLAMAAASVAPPAARWTGAMTRRWGRRAAATGAITAAVFGAVLVVGEGRVGGTAIVLVAALVSVMAAGWWMRSAAVRPR